MQLEELIMTLKQRRLMLTVTQEYLAELSGVALRTIKEIESGKGNPTFATLSRIADVLGMEIKLVVKQPVN
ncbi:MAG: helix-turn-helix transcriptional regulator [Blastocatellia bacterium]|nr:helix-turn-helix transcriptional regulator [Blastocatellia bacterium]